MNTSPSPSRKPTEVRKLLIIGDQPVPARESWLLALEDCGYRLQQARNVIEAVAACRSEKHDALLVNCQAPSAEGLAYLRHLRAEMGAQIPKIIFAAGESGLDAIWQALGLGADEYILRPINPAALVVKLESLA